MSARSLVALGVLLVGAVAAPAARATIPSDNLILNFGAEDDPGSEDAACGGDVDVTSWEPETGAFTAVRYGVGAFPTLGQAPGVLPGANFFAGGCAGTEDISTAEQTANVSVAAPEIDAGGVQAELAGFLGGYSSQDDQAMVEVFFLGAGSSDLGADGPDLTIGPVTAGDRGLTTGFLFRSATGAVPAGTRSIRTLMTMTRFSGAANDGYAEGLSLNLSGGGAPPPPVLGKQVNASVVSGTVLVAVPARGGRAGRARASQKGLRFVPLTDARQIPTGSFLDTSRGTVSLTSATGAGKKTQSGQFGSGVFQVLQSRKRREKGLTELRLSGSSFKRCGRASAAGVSSRTIRRLRSNATGRFRTRGKHSAATVRGTVWTTADRCDGTLTSVQRGRVAVRDFRRKRTVVVRAGRSYLARAAG